MRCLSCNEAMSDREANRKYVNAKDIPNTEDRYIGLCDGCLKGSDLFYMAFTEQVEMSLDDEE